MVHAIVGHHDDLRIDNPYTVLVSAADACSASRPGARRETLERYVKRLEELEAIAGASPASSRPSPSRPAANCGCMVNAKETTDETAAKICRDIATRLRAAAHLSGRDQGHRAAGDPARGNGKVKRDLGIWGFGDLGTEVGV